uniref:Uncharacterized conserved protein, DUF4415 family n=1 Tax=Candidatus Kentrum sp. MB TaxID=2138164 RepID=A0A450XG46_9GAMM|nr:MAG: Uncharacterized conserved protein, DUF4415 family [Candidatus Kentron sp. MB]VFK32559.1 MAG: Uncharacterized conserved protein, DUF4415 family [Candidatus Kentron sp. MB]VFK75978.1 MAG: Uncharacterized conserved protein, DUF4415 family [Candidatus Kentron sp. MB]
MNENRYAISTGWIDPDDAPELTDEFFEIADEYIGEKLIRRGRPLKVEPEPPVSIYLSSEVVGYPRATGKGWQTGMDIG